MKFINNDESEKWIDNLISQHQKNEFDLTIKFNVEDERYRSYVISKEIVSWFREFYESIFLIKEYGIWPSSENWHLFYKLRESYNESNKLRITPGHIFTKTERDDLATYLSLAIQFGWGGYLLSNNVDIELKLSHDGFIELWTNSKNNLIEDSLEKFSIDFEIGTTDNIITLKKKG